jgi:DNA polymerase/3'-5' exonuclease PolX
MSESVVSAKPRSEQELEQYARSRRGKIQAQISSFERGLEIFKDISMVRVKNKKNALTILEDYTPVVAQVNGDVQLIGRDIFHELKNVKGFLCHVHNVFFLIQNERGLVAPEKEEKLTSAS